jgi:hypothetical protein
LLDALLKAVARLKDPPEEQDAQADDHQRDAGGGSYSHDLVHAYLRLEAPTP